MKKRNNRFLAGTLAGLMMLTMLPVTALAAQEGADGDAASDTSNNIVNVVSDGKNGQPAENNDVNITENGGTENAQKSADASSGDTENVQESADDSNGGSDDTAAANQQEGEVGGSGTIMRRLHLRRQSSRLRLTVRRSMAASRKRLLRLTTAIRLKSVRILPLVLTV